MSIQKTITPIDNSVYIERPLSSDNEINDILDKSKKSFISWKNTSIDDRIIIINKFIDNLLNLNTEVSKEICWQIGRPITQCGNELRGFEERSRHMVEIAKESLQNIGIQGLTVTEIKGFGRQKGHTELYRGAEYIVDFLPKIKIELIVDDSIASQVIEEIIKSSKTGKIGDGKIFVTEISQVIRIRTGEEGSDAL